MDELSDIGPLVAEPAVQTPPPAMEISAIEPAPEPAYTDASDELSLEPESAEPEHAIDSPGAFETPMIDDAPVESINDAPSIVGAPIDRVELFGDGILPIDDLQLDAEKADLSPVDHTRFDAAIVAAISPQALATLSDLARAEAPMTDFLPAATDEATDDAPEMTPALDLARLSTADHGADVNDDHASIETLSASDAASFEDATASAAPYNATMFAAQRPRTSHSIFRG